MDEKMTMNKVVAVVLFVTSFLAHMILIIHIDWRYIDNYSVQAFMIGLLVYAVIYHFYRLFYFYNNAKHKNLLKVIQTVLLAVLFARFWYVREINPMDFGTVYWDIIPFMLLFVIQDIDGYVLVDYLGIKRKSIFE